LPDATIFQTDKKLKLAAEIESNASDIIKWGKI
jgi:hypothetical protein